MNAQCQTSTNVRERPFEDYFAIPLRNGLTKPKRVRGAGTKMVNMGELFAHDRIHEAGMDRVPMSEKETALALLEMGDLLFARQSLVREGAGKCSIFLGDSENVTFESHIIRARLDPTTADPLFFFFYFESPQGRLIMDTIVEQVAAAGIRGSDLARLPVPCLPLDGQTRIAHILRTLDDKIELNRRMNRTLEAIARAIFKSWFIDFDPVIDNALASGKPIPEEFAERAAHRAQLNHEESSPPVNIRRLFPDEFQDSESGPIPKGWEVRTLGDVAEHPRRSVQVDQIDPETPYIALDHMPKQCIALSDWGTADGLQSNKFEFRQGEILFGKLRPYFHKVGIAPVDGICSTDIIVIKPRQDVWFGFVLGYVSSSQFVDYTTAGSTGTRMPRTNWKEMARYPVVIPPVHLAEVFTKQVKMAVDRIIATIHESRTLAALRDALLPKLISGEIWAKDVKTSLKEREL